MSASEPLKTPLCDWHQAHGGRMVEFGGWTMPVQYTTITEEHHAVRKAVGLFDISHMGRLIVVGPGATFWLNRTTTNDVTRLEDGQIQYSLMTNEQGGAIDDLLVYRLRTEDHNGARLPVYLVVCNASNRVNVISQLLQYRGDLEVELDDRTAGNSPDFATAMIAVQGPSALATLQKLFPDDAERLAGLKYYHVLRGIFRAPDGTQIGEPIVSRSGYTGEDGFELIVRRGVAVTAWEAILAAGQEFGIRPCGLGSRDTLRFEAAMPLYGHELDATINPFEAGLGRFVKLDKGDFVGREVLRAVQSQPARERVGLALEGKRIARQGCPVLRDSQTVGVVTSGTFAPTLDRSLAMALVTRENAPVGSTLEVDVRGRLERAKVVPLPFYRRSR